MTAFVPLGGALEAETWLRGQTIYLPDGSVPLHPLSLSEGAASLLPGELRPAVLWTIDLDSHGERTGAMVERAMVSSRAKLDYVGVQAAATAGTLPESIALLPELGRLLIERGLDRGAINLPIPEQEVERDGADGWRLVLRSPMPAEDWNAQISLLTGVCAADGPAAKARFRSVPGCGSTLSQRTRSADSSYSQPDNSSGRKMTRLRPYSVKPRVDATASMVESSARARSRATP